jgi:hypothetical protein
LLGQGKLAELDEQLDAAAAAAAKFIIPDKEAGCIIALSSFVCKCRRRSSSGRAAAA